MFPALLKKGEGVRVIAPSRSMRLGWMTKRLKLRAQERLEKSVGLNVTFGAHVNDCDMFDSTTVEGRVKDLHDAFADPSVQLVLTVIGGYNSNQLLESIDYDLIARNPKRLCGYSDITALSNAIFAKTGLVTYSGPHFINFGQRTNFDETQDAFVRCHFAAGSYAVVPSKDYYDGFWSKRDLPPIPNPGWRVHSEGEATGTIIGGNLCTFALLHGTQYLPDPPGDVILFLEDDEGTNPAEFDRQLQALLHQRFAARIKGVAIGRFETKHIRSRKKDQVLRVTPEKLDAILASKHRLRGIPVISGVDFGHTHPMITFPIGGKVAIVASKEGSHIEILAH